MTPLTVATVEPWQHSSPTGGLIQSTWVNAYKLGPGCVVRRHDGWLPITRMWQNATTHALYVEVQRLDGTHQVTTFVEGFEVRDDMRWDAYPVARCGCWASYDGQWTCDKHLRRRRLRREASRRPRTTRPLFHQARAERLARAVTTPVPVTPSRHNAH